MSRINTTGGSLKGPVTPKPVSSITPPRTPISDVEQVPPGSPFGNFPVDDTYPHVSDPAQLSEGRTVSTKQSNRPFLACVHLA